MSRTGAAKLKPRETFCQLLSLPTLFNDEIAGHFAPMYSPTGFQNNPVIRYCSAKYLHIRGRCRACEFCLTGSISLCLVSSVCMFVLFCVILSYCICVVLL